VVATNDGALAAWVCASLLGLALGLGIAKYSQAWAEHALHPGAAAGTLIVVMSIALTVVAARYAASGAGGHVHRQFSQALAVLGTMLVVMLAWISLAVIYSVGGELPPPRPRWRGYPGGLAVEGNVYVVLAASLVGLGLLVALVGGEDSIVAALLLLGCLCAIAFLTGNQPGW